MSDNIPGAQLVCIEGAGHLPNMEAPREFNEALDAFLRSHALQCPAVLRSE
jgi:pimeloyl-ACP methyl ester carboxylesterase